MSSNFNVGDEVVCVYASPNPNTHPSHYDLISKLVLNEVYIISEIRPCVYDPSQVTLGFSHLLLPNGSMFGYRSQRFRKVQKKLTGMETLRGLLKTKELEDA